MTFSDNLQHIPMMLLCSLSVACWAPEVEPPTPKVSPAEIAGLSIATASASSLDQNTMRHIPSQQAEFNPKSSTPAQSPLPSQKASTTLEVPKTFPYQAKIKGAMVPLLGHGGGTILMLAAEELTSATIEVLEEQNGKARVLCRGCSPSHPYQAGWVSMDYIQPNN